MLVKDTLKKLKTENKKAFIPYLTYGYPTRQIFKQLVLAAANAGADMIEIGMPFSDPIADGPVICAASEVALNQGATLTKLLADLKQLKNKVCLPFLLMSYYNPIYYAGVDKFCAKANKVIDGLVIPDLLPEQSKALVVAAKKNNIATVFFIASTTDLNRYLMIDKVSSGFIYFVSVLGTTGVKKEFDPNIFKAISLARQKVQAPIVVGFGISTNQQIKKFNAVSDGVIVGSAIIAFIRDHYQQPKFLEKFKKYLRGLKG